VGQSACGSRHIQIQCRCDGRPWESFRGISWKSGMHLVRALR
jgi:hypothetical protein